MCLCMSLRIRSTRKPTKSHTCQQTKSAGDNGASRLAEVPSSELAETSHIAPTPLLLLTRRSWSRLELALECCCREPVGCSEGSGAFFWVMADSQGYVSSKRRQVNFLETVQEKQKVDAACYQATKCGTGDGACPAMLDFGKLAEGSYYASSRQP